MSEIIKIQGVGVSQVAAAAPESAATGQSPAPAAACACADHVGTSVPKIGAEGAKLSALDAPKAGGVGIRGSSRVADGGDIWAGMMIGGLWADAVSH